MAQLRDAFSRFAGGVVDRLPSLLTALVVVLLLAGLAHLVRRWVETAVGRTTTHAYLPVLLARLAYIGMLLVALVVALAVAGVNLGWLLGSVSLLTVVLGVALRDVLSDVVAGIVLLLEHPLTVGDVVSTSGVSGTVEDIRLRATWLRAPDGQQVVLPNSLLFASVVTNASAARWRRAEIVFRLAKAADAPRARDILCAQASTVPGVMADPAPRTITRELGPGADSPDGAGLVLALWVWIDPQTQTDDATTDTDLDLDQLRSAVLERVAAALQAAGISLTTQQAPRPSPSPSPGPSSQHA